MKITKKHIRYLLIIAQLLLWVGFVWVLFENRRQASQMVEGVEAPLLRHLILVCLPFILLINVNWYYLAPKLLRKGSYLKYVLLVGGLILLCAFLLSLNSSFNDSNQLRLMVADPSYSFLIPSFLMNAYFMVITYLISMPFYLSVSWFDQQGKISKLESENLRTELTSLKEQINPHFFFNTLNNLYSLTLTNSDKASEVILKLSELMRYVIYDAKKPLVMIQEEFDYLESYLEIQRIRLGEETELTFSHEVDDPTTQVIPLLFINVLENAFKHGAESMTEGGYVHCSLKMKDGKLYFQVRNSYEKNESLSKGTGLENLTRRLELVYPNAHSLSVKDYEDTFDVSLVIEKTDEISHSR